MMIAIAVGFMESHWISESIRRVPKEVHGVKTFEARGIYDPGDEINRSKRVR